MWFRKILLGVLTFGVAAMGLAFGALFVICLSLYVLWHGLSLSIIVFGALFLACTMVARGVLRQVTARDQPELSSREATLLLEGRDGRQGLGSRGGTANEWKRRKML